MAIQGQSKSIRNLIMGDNMSFHVPIYQRSYTWNAKQEVEKFITDILEFAEETRQKPQAEYYVGNVILKNQNQGFVTQRTVIDGQQRITTTILTLCALRDLYLERQSSDEELASARAISNALNIDDGTTRRLKLNNMEHQKTLDRLLSGHLDAIATEDKATRYWKCYDHIKRKLTRLHHDGDWRLTELSSILDRVVAVAIFLDDDQDENSVFESINSAGKPLSGPDLIKNFMFTFWGYEVTRQQEQELTTLYTDRFESLFSNRPDGDIEAFFREYIAVKTGQKVNKDPKVIYYSFKRLVGKIESFDACKRRIQELIKWGVIYTTLACGDHPDLDPTDLGYLRESFQTYASLLMDMVDRLAKVEDGQVVVHDSTALGRAIRRVVAYDVSRFLAGPGSKAIARFVPTVQKTLADEDPNFWHDYAGAFWHKVQTAERGYRCPPPVSIIAQSDSLDLYGNRKQLVRFLVLLDNAGMNERIDFGQSLSKCQVEHIMPQTLGPAWSHISQQDHQRFLHTLGNLSITFDNQALGNLGFAQKKRLLAERSRVRLNQMLLDYESFGPEEIRHRAKRLLKMFFEAYDITVDEDANLPVFAGDAAHTPQQWLDKVRTAYQPPELSELPLANSWRKICDHLGLTVGGNSAHRVLESWVTNNKPSWPSTW